MKIVVTLLLFLIPLVWSRQINANYLSAKTFLFFLTSALSLFFISNEFYLRSWPKRLIVPLLLILVYHFSYYFWGDGFQWSHLFFSFKSLSFVFLIYYFYSQQFILRDFIKKISLPFLALWICIISITFWQIIQLRFIEGNIKTDAILSTFGNVNMFSQFLTFCLPFVYLWLRQQESKSYQYLKFVILFSIAFFILYCRSRSALLSLGLWSLFLVYYRLLKKPEILALVSAGVLFIISHYATSEIVLINKFAPQFFSERASLYQASFELLKDKPLGIPIGQFMNEVVPYLIDKQVPANEFSYFDQPHSEFLKWGIQFGWAYLFLCSILLVVLVLELFKKYKSDLSEDKIESVFFISCLLVVLPEVTFQFPFENPASLLAMALMFGLFLSSYSVKKMYQLKLAFPIIGLLALAGILNSFLYIGSIYFQSHYSNSPDLMNIACQAYPADFRPCFYKNKSLFDSKNINSFKAEFAKDFQDNPFYCDNLRLLPDFMNYSTDIKKTCEALLLYKIIYKNQRNFMPQTYENCKAYQSPVQFVSGAQFSADFKKWFSENK